MSATRRSGRVIWMAVASAVLTTVFAAVPAAAAPPGGPGATPAAARSASAGTPDVQRVCSAPTAPGRAACLSIRRTDAPGHKGRFAAAQAPSGYGPSDLTSAYRLPADGSGTGDTVAIVDAFDDPTAEADLGVYRSQYGLPGCTTANGCFRKVDQRGGSSYPTADSSWSEEISLDLDMVSAVCPHCGILLVEADSSDLNDLAGAVDTAVHLGAKFVSNSYGGAEDSSLAPIMAAHYNHPGVAITASSGDSGYGVQYPAASRYVTAVGGTSLTRDSGARGWRESAWSGAGSGCSTIETKPSWQHDAGCPNRTVTDVSAVADPHTGVAVYDSYQFQGWSVFGGTSVSSPIIASVYALAGAPAAGSYPSALPYGRPSALNDVTDGSNGSCSPAYLCTAGPGYDGPTGLGTPVGVAAFSSGPHGTIVGTVTDAATRAPVAGAQLTITKGGVTAGSVTTDATGHYTIDALAGSYALTTTKFGYLDKAIPAVQVGDGTRVTEDIALTTAPPVAVSGVVTDGSGHGWPLTATVSCVVGCETAGRAITASTNPVTGRYALTMPGRHDYRLQVSANGYQPADISLHLGVAAAHADSRPAVDPDSGCAAPGYHRPGISQGFDARALPAGWSVTDPLGNRQVWRFDNPQGQENDTGSEPGSFLGHGNMAILPSGLYNSTAAQDSSLVSPAVDMSRFDAPLLEWYSYAGGLGQATDVDLSLDGGKSWSTVWHHLAGDGWSGSGFGIRGLQRLPLPQAARHHQVQVRFHWSGTGDAGTSWEIDSVFLGDHTCAVTPGGLVTGQVTDRNTGSGVAGATIASTAGTATSDATGRFTLLAPAGRQRLTVTAPYHPVAATTLGVVANAANTAKVSMAAGRLTVTVSTTSLRATMGGRKQTVTVKVKNTGTAPATVRLAGRQGGATPLTSRGTAAATGQAWTRPADMPIRVSDNAAATDPDTGQIYAVGGVWNTCTHGCVTPNVAVYDPATDTWSWRVPNMPGPKAGEAAAFVDGKLYVLGGWADGLNNETGIGWGPQGSYAYDPRTNRWGTEALEPHQLAGSGVATLNGRVYLVGGCDFACDHTDVQVFDPASNTWSAAARYPEPVAWPSCGAIRGQIYCAGGANTVGSSRHTYRYDPVGNRWYSVAVMPQDLWGSAYSTGGGRLLVSGGVTGGIAGDTNNNPGRLSLAGYSYNPVTNTWSKLPAATTPNWRGASACGFYTTTGGAQAFPFVDHGSNVFFNRLPGYDGCDGDTGVPWLAVPNGSTTLTPGKSTTLTLTVNPGDPSIAQPGTFVAHLAVGQDTPYDLAPVDLALVEAPPSTWGKIAGTVRGADCSGTTALSGATVQLITKSGTHTLTTDANGSYQLWLDKRDGPVTVVVSKDGWPAQTRRVTIRAGATTTADFTLVTAAPCPAASR